MINEDVRVYTTHNTQQHIYNTQQYTHNNNNNNNNNNNTHTQLTQIRGHQSNFLSF
jgi:hypothetical protein